MSSSYFPLLRVPAEIRNEIYEIWAAGYVEDRDRIFIRSGNVKFQAREAYPALLQTCRQINREAYGIFLKAIRLEVMPALDHRVYVRGQAVPTSNRTHDVRNLKIRMGTWLETSHVIFCLCRLFEVEDLQRVVFKIGPSVFTCRWPKDDTHIGTTVQVEESKRDSFGPLRSLAWALLYEAHQSPYLPFMAYVIARGTTAWKHALGI